MANLQHVNILKSGVEAWNNWRQANREEVVDLSKADLSNADLRKANLKEANLKKVNLGEYDTLFGYESANLEGADLEFATLEEASLCAVNLRRANLLGAKLGKANLVDADLTGANLLEADLEGANLKGAILGGADIRDAKGLILDNSFVRGVHLHAHARDPWSILRRHYTGPRFIFNLFFLVAFLFP